MKVLIIEDDPTTVELIRTILKECKWEMQDCNGLEEGFRLRHSFDPDVVLLDLNLADADRDETLAAIPRLAENALIVLTGNADPITVASAFKQGADDCLDKACLGDKKRFIAAIRTAWERFTRKKQLSHD